MRFFLGLRPVDHLVVILDEDDYQKNKDKLNGLDNIRNKGFKDFNLSGHTEGKKFRPWQMADDKRM